MYKERVQTRQLRTRPKTAIKSRDKQTTVFFLSYRRRERGTPPIVLTIVGTPSRDFSATEEKAEEVNRQHPTPSSLHLPRFSFFRSVVSLWRFASPLISARFSYGPAAPSSGPTGFSRARRARESDADRTAGLKQLSSRPRCPRHNVTAGDRSRCFLPRKSLIIGEWMPASRSRRGTTGLSFFAALFLGYARVRLVSPF